MDKYTTTQGHNFSTGEWLDLHFDACITEYENMVKSLGIQPGWKVLDAGCGNGRFLKVISELVTATGEVYAVDLAQENINHVDAQIKSGFFQPRIFTSVGDVASLNFPDNTFDLIWCANVTQYLDKAKLNQTLQVFKKLLKPGGTVAIKETDGTSYFFYPTKNFNLFWDSIKPMDLHDRQRWFDNPLEFCHLLNELGFHSTKQSTHLVERRNPLDERTKKYLSTLFEIKDVNWSEIEKQTPENQYEWNEILDKSSPSYILSQPNFFWREGHMLATGIK